MSATRAATAFDEVFAADGAPRPFAEALVAELDRLGAQNLIAAGALRDAIFMRQGITFDLTSADGEIADRPFPLDLIPRIIPGAEWRTIKRGLAQRIRALNQFVDDVYHEREIIKAGIVPWTLVASRSHFARADPLRETALDRPPLGARDDPRDEVEREWPVGDEPVVAAQVEGDALAHEDRVAQRARGDQPVGAEPLELVDQRRRMLTRQALGGEDLVKRVSAGHSHILCDRLAARSSQAVRMRGG